MDLNVKILIMDIEVVVLGRNNSAKVSFPTFVRRCLGLSIHNQKRQFEFSNLGPFLEECILYSMSLGAEVICNTSIRHCMTQNWDTFLIENAEGFMLYKTINVLSNQ